MQIKESLGLTNKQVQNRDQAQGVGKAAGQTGSASGAEARTASADRVELSGRSRDLSRAADAVATAPEVREQKVAELKSRIQNNQYEVDADKVAKKMIVDFLNELV